MFLSAGQTSDYIGARALLSSIPQAGALLGDRGYDADWFRNALIEMKLINAYLSSLFIISWFSPIASCHFP